MANAHVRQLLADCMSETQPFHFRYPLHLVSVLAPCEANAHLVRRYVLDGVAVFVCAPELPNLFALYSKRGNLKRAIQVPACPMSKFDAYYEYDVYCIVYCPRWCA